MGFGSLHFFDDGVCHLGCSYGGGVVSVGFHIVRDIFAFCYNGGDGGLEFFCFGHPAEMAQHHNSAEYQGGWIDFVLALVFGGTAVGGFECGDGIADICAGSDAEAANEACTQIAEDIAVEVGQDDYIVKLGLLD